MRFEFRHYYREAIWPVLIVAQIFGVMPVSGVSSKSISDLHFNWKSKRTVHSLIVAVILIVNFLMQLECVFARRAGSRVTEVLLFYVLNTIDFFCFFALALKWPKLMKYWSDIEHKLPSFDNVQQKKRFILKVRCVAFGFLFLALVEHNLELVAHIYYIIVCKGKNPLFEHVRVYTLYKDDVYISPFEAIFLKITIVIISFVWTYRDVFLITIGMALTSQLRLFNNQLKQIKGKHTSNEFWIYQRRQYIQLCDLVQTVDNAVAILVLMSFTNNMYYICKQLFLSLRPLPTVLSMVYFWFSLSFIIIRASLTSLFLSRINDEAKAPLDIIKALPTQSWNMDAERFFNDVTNDNIALTGMGLFSVTRKLILSVVSTIVTYDSICTALDLLLADNKQINDEITFK